jgi:hypothetical protein
LFIKNVIQNLFWLSNFSSKFHIFVKLRPQSIICFQGPHLLLCFFIKKNMIRGRLFNFRWDVFFSPSQTFFFTRNKNRIIFLYENFSTLKFYKNSTIKIVFFPTESEFFSGRKMSDSFLYVKNKVFFLKTFQWILHPRIILILYLQFKFIFTLKSGNKI